MVLGYSFLQAIINPQQNREHKMSLSYYRTPHLII